MLPAETATALCANCEAPLRSEYCSECGQHRVQPMRSIWHLLRDATEDLTHTDSRVWRTLASLAVRPRLLLREYLAGRRARYLPPFRLYLVLSIVFFALAAAGPSKVYVVRLDPGQLGKAVTAAHPEHVCEREYHGLGARAVQQFMKTRCPELLSDGGKSLAAAYTHNLPRAMFLFLPLLALFMKAMYWRPPRYYVEHWLFLLYSQSFVFLLAIIGMLAAYVLPQRVDSGLTLALWLYAAYYLFGSLRVAYQQSRARTAFKFALLGVAYFVCGFILLVVTTLYTALTM
jgi:hypothetical protein